MDSLECPRIAVIGGGASATLFLAALQARNVCDLTVDVYDRTGRFARGIAYSTPHPHHLLNVRAANMSGLAGDKDHFAKWAQEHGYTPADFVPRRMFGLYLDTLFKHAEEQFAVNGIIADVKTCERSETGFVINGLEEYDAVVQCTGNVVPLGPRAANDIAGYFPDPWAIQEQDVQNAQSIALVGTGLTAVDAILTLRSYGYDGIITMISRRSLLPAVHVPPASWPRSPLSADDAGKPLSHLLGMLRVHIREAAAQNLPWQAVIDSLRPVTNILWQGMDEVQRKRFGRHLMTLWNVHRHRMAPTIAAEIEMLRQTGRLAFLRDSVRDISAGPVVNGARGAHRFDIVINCMGYRYHETGRHYDVSHAIGPARFGPLFETTAIPEIRAQADEVAAQVIATVCA